MVVLYYAAVFLFGLDQFYLGSSYMPGKSMFSITRFCNEKKNDVACKGAPIKPKTSNQTQAMRFSSIVRGGQRSV